MVEPLKELNHICQKPNYKKAGNWMVRHVLRDAALPITWLLLHTNITANQVTLASLIIGLTGIGMFSITARSAFLIGAIFLQVWYLLDHVDGHIARYRKTACLSGRFFDFLTHHIINGVIFFALGVYCFQVTGKVSFVILGFLTSMAMIVFNLLHDTKYKTFFERIVQDKNVSLKAGNGETVFSRTEKQDQILRSGFAFLHKICEIHVLMNILTAAALLETIMKLPFGLRFVTFLLYSIIVPLLAVTKTSHLILTREIDREFEDIFAGK